MDNVVTRDYSITGPERAKAQEKGLISAEWYQCPVPRKRMKELISRKNIPAIRDTLLWLALMGALGYLAYLSWGTWFAIPVFIVYGTVYSVSVVSRWHEFSHGTPFRTSWLNEVMYQFYSFLILALGTGYRWSHVRHHTDTIIVGSDPEISTTRPPNLVALIRYGIIRLNTIHKDIQYLYSHACGHLTEAEKELIPPDEQRKLFWEARIMLLLYSGIVGICIYIRSIMPLMFIGLPVFYGFFLISTLSIMQHSGLYEDTPDHRLCVRTFYTNRLLQFIYTNMNYHMEHHMFPMVPFYNLPKLHEEIKNDCPAAAPSFAAAFSETLYALVKIQYEPDYVVPKYREFAERKSNSHIPGGNYESA
jgi:fatty acid desaturase